MLFEIKSRFDSSVIFSIEAEILKFAVEEAVRLKRNLRGAYLRGAYLQGADLQGADLQGADFRGAKNLNPYLCTPLLMLLDQPGSIIAYKLINGRGDGPFNGGIKYEIGQQYQVDDANTDPLVECGKGINLGTLDWCMKNWQQGYRILKAEFTAEDIAAIPTATDGKFRCKKVKIVGEVDLEKIGLVKEEEAMHEIF